MPIHRLFQQLRLQDITPEAIGAAGEHKVEQVQTMVQQEAQKVQAVQQVAAGVWNNGLVGLAVGAGVVKVIAVG